MSDVPEQKSIFDKEKDKRKPEKKPSKIQYPTNNYMSTSQKLSIHQTIGIHPIWRNISSSRLLNPKYPSLGRGNKSTNTNKANLRGFIAATGLVTLLKLDWNLRLFDPCDVWPWQSIEHLFYATSNLCIISKPSVNSNYCLETFNLGQNGQLFPWVMHISYWIIDIKRI